VLFAQTVARMTEEIKALGPLDWPHNWPSEDPFTLRMPALHKEAVHE
jgi:hypothetical protein